MKLLLCFLIAHKPHGPIDAHRGEVVYRCLRCDSWYSQWWRS